MRNYTVALNLLGEPTALVSFGSLAQFYLPTGLSTGNMPRYCTWNFCTSSVFGVGKSTTGNKSRVFLSSSRGRGKSVVHLQSAHPDGDPYQSTLFPDVGSITTALPDSRHRGFASLNPTDLSFKVKCWGRQNPVCYVFHVLRNSLLCPIC